MNPPPSSPSRAARKRVLINQVIQRALLHLATDLVNVPLERQDAEIKHSLATIGPLIHADRAYLFAYDFAAGVMSNTHEWCEAGIPPEIGNLQKVSTELFPDWVAAHRRGERVHIPSVSALPADSNLRQILAPQGIRSLINLPLMQDSVCLGFVGFDAVREERTWREDEVSILRVLAELYAHFESRRASERETRELQKRLTQARDAAEAAARAKGLFLANISHEIRTPLNAILGYAQIMSHTCATCETGKHGVATILKSGEHLLDLLNSILTSVRLDSQKTLLEETSFDFPLLLNDVCPAALPPAATESPRAESRRRILIVDDDDDNRKMLSTMLNRADFDTTLAASGQQALDALADRVPVDVILMDACMPGMDGIETIRRIRDRPGMAGLPILLVTGLSESDEATTASTANANGCIFKPVRREQLLKEIRRVTGLLDAKDTSAAKTRMPDAQQPPVYALHEAFRCLPAALAAAFGLAVCRGDINALRSTLASVRSLNPLLADHLSPLIATYDYDALRQLLDPNPGDPS